MQDNKIKILNEDEYSHWDDLANNSMQATIFHSRYWINTCASLLNMKSLFFGNFRDGILIGGCPLFVNRSPFLRSAFSNPPLTPYAGFLLRDSRTTRVRKRELQAFSTIKSISHEMIKSKFDIIRLVNAPKLQDIRPFTWNGWKPEVNYTYILPLLNTDIEKNLSYDARRNIRMAQKVGINVRKIFVPELMWKMNLDTYKRQNLKPPFNEIYLKKIMEKMKDKNLGEMWVAETASGEPVSSIFVIWNNYNMAHGWSGASISNLRDTGAYSLLLLEISRDLQRRGFRDFELGAGNTPRLTMYYSSFNPRLMPYFGVEWSATKYRLCIESQNCWNSIRRLVSFQNMKGNHSILPAVSLDFSAPR